LQEFLVMLGAKVAQVACEEQMVLELAGRAHRDEHEAGKLSFTGPPTSLGYVGRDRGTATTQLGGKPKRLLSRKSASSIIDIQDEAVTSLLNLQILEVPHTAG
jgi:hypothetical protein